VDRERQPVSGTHIAISSPWFEDLKIGDVFADAPAVTLHSGHAVVHQACFGDRMPLPLDERLCRAVIGEGRWLVHPNVVCNLAIGQSTAPTGRVKGNLFYRGLVLRRPVFVGDTLRTATTVVALRQNRPRPEREATGMVVLQIHTENQDGDAVLHFWRCAMLPCRDPRARTGHADSFDAIPAELDLAEVHAAVPADWRLEVFRSERPGGHFADVPEAARYSIEGRDTVSSAPEIARLTGNLAMAHTDAGASSYGRRLVYGGHAISMACAQISRALPNLVTLLAWRSCDHTAPVFEGDVLRTELEVAGRHPRSGGGGLVDLRALVYAERVPGSEDEGEEVQVLDWRVLALMA
jgi:acyl dehydratase